MKKTDIYTKRINCTTPDEVFKHLLTTLQPSNRTWDYFINWNKVFGNVLEIEISLNTLNVIIGKDDIEEVLSKLLKLQPQLAKVFPILLASRDSSFTILESFSLTELTFINFDFSNIVTLTDKEIVQAVAFLKNSGFLQLLEDKKIKNLVDYVIGTEAGMDTNGRKNRSGHTMENIVEFFITNICEKHNWKYLREANAKALKKEWNIDLPVDKSSRRLDFVVNTGSSIYLIETNFYGGGGSKLKSTATEYQKMYDYWTIHGFKFLWITDGLGWHTADLPLRESFDKIDYILNLDMLSKNVLEDIFEQDI